MPLICSLLLAVAPQATTPASYALPVTNIVVIGDSNSESNFYVTQWWEWVNLFVPQVEITSVAWGGAKVTGGDGILQLAIAETMNPDIILVNLGTNDVGGNSVAQINAAYATLESMATTKLYFIQPIEWMPSPLVIPDPTYLNDKIKLLDYDISMFGLIPSVGYFLDGMHINSIGGYFFAQRVEGILLNRIL